MLTSSFGVYNQESDLYKSTVLHITYFPLVKEKHGRQLLLLPRPVRKTSRLLQERSKQATSDIALRKAFH
jgi:hypothetical protein